MKKSELSKLRKNYNEELERLIRIKELLSDERCKELISLSKINVDEFEYIDELKIVESILKDFDIKETNDIYICTGAFVTEWDICYEDTTSYEREVPFDYKNIEYKQYRNLENKKKAVAFTKPEYKKIYYPEIITSKFEKDYIVLNPYNTSENDNGYEEIRNEFFMNCIDFGQVKSKKMLLERYKRM